MTHTFFLDIHTEVIPARATGYAPREGGGFSVEIVEIYFPPAAAGGRQG
jgi:hypothetical protein